MATQDLIGRKFGRLTVIRRAEHDNRKYVYWSCQCDCGTIKKVRNDHLVNGKTVSCGCYIKELSSSLHGTHRMTGTRLYNVWSDMKTRCYNERTAAYKNYGGRGIKMCEEWLDFENFRKWAKDNGYDKTAARGECTIDRKNVNGNYEPSNCRFITMAEQAGNKRSAVSLTFNGETKSISQWSDETGIDRETIRTRLKRGYGAEKALTKSTDIYKYYATFDGITKPVKDWCKELGIPYKTIHYRLKNGMNPELALTKPIGGSRHYDESNRISRKVPEDGEKL
jgi:hypothetical protein